MKTSFKSFSRFFLPVAVLVPVLIFSGCAGIKTLPYKNIVMFDHKGYPVHPCTSTTKRNVPNEGECEDVSSLPRLGHYEPIPDFPKYLEPMFSSMDAFFAKNKSKKIVIYVHGGLNTRGGTLERVANNSQWGEPLYKEILNSKQYPVFINWNSGLLSSYSDHLFSVRQGEDSPFLGALTWPVYLGMDILRSLSRAPMVLTSLLLEDVKANNMIAPIFDKKSAVEVGTDIYCRNHLGVDPDGHPGLCSETAPTPVHDKFDLTVGHDQRGIGEMVVAGTQYLVTLPAKMVVAPALDAIGTSAWNNMLRRVNLLYHVDKEFHVEKDPQSLSALARNNSKLGLSRIPASGGLSLFMKAFISRYCTDLRDHKDEWEITLVGHSMGTIVLNELVRNFGKFPANQCEDRKQPAQLSEKNKPAEPPIYLPIKNIVYMASASTIRHYENTVVPFLEDTDANFYNLMLGRQAEIRETQAWGLSPRGSLLVWIDNFFSNPLTHRDRMLGRFDNFMIALHDIPEPVRDRIHIKSFNTGWKVEETEPQKHGDFSNLKFWEKDCWKASPPDEKECYKKP